MTEFSQSHFLQSAGWAILNSFWQLAILWMVYMLLTHMVKFTPQARYRIAAGAVFAGFAWFVITFLVFWLNRNTGPLHHYLMEAGTGNSILKKILVSASGAYLALLVIPSWRLLRNWRFVQKIRREGIMRMPPEYRLFVQRIAGHLGIGRKVFVYLSDIISSPVTVGYLKPVILLPVAAMNQLSVSQVEAVLLHELSHIRRYDYLVNLLISIISTILYFNPFLKFFIREMETEREACCDQLVLQFEYDRVSYASALLALEKASSTGGLLVIGATGKNNLLNRIETIIGMEKKKKFSFQRLAGVLAALFCIIAINSILLTRTESKPAESYFHSPGNPFIVFGGSNNRQMHSDIEAEPEKKPIAVTESPAVLPQTAAPFFFPYYYPVESAEDFLVHVAVDEADLALTTAEKEQVKKTVDATRKVVCSLQWNEIDNTIADAMDSREKALAKQQYMRELDRNVNWKDLEKKLRVRYDDVNWQQVNTNLNQALTVIQLDSIQRSYSMIVTQLAKANAQANTDAGAQSCVTPIPDISVEEMKKAQDELQSRVNTIRATTAPKKIVKL